MKIKDNMDIHRPLPWIKNGRYLVINLIDFTFF